MERISQTCRRGLAGLLIAAGLAGVVSEVARAQCELARMPLVNSGIASTTESSRRVAMSEDGTVIAVGAPLFSDPPASEGAVYVFTTTTHSFWVLADTIHNPYPAAHDQFGWAVDITADGSRIIVGAPKDDYAGPDSGAAYVFLRNGDTWDLEAPLPGLTTVSNDFAGTSVAISKDGTRAVTGSPNSSHIVDAAGLAQSFVRTRLGWADEAVIAPDDLAMFDRFGAAIGLTADGRSVLISSPFNDALGQNHGAVFAFQFNGSFWEQRSRIEPVSPAQVGAFGVDLAISDNGRSAIINAPFEFPDDEVLGAAYMFRTNDGVNWTQEARLTDASGMIDSPFALDVDMTGDGEKVIVGRAHRGNVDDPGDALVYRRHGNGTWERDGVLRPAINSRSERYGEEVTMSPDGTVGIALSGRIAVNETSIHFADMHKECLMLLVRPLPNRAGEVNTLLIDFKSPGTTMYLAYSLQKGTAIIPTCFAPSIELKNPKVVASTVMDEFGLAEFEVFVPLAARGRTVYFQAADPEACQGSNVVETVFE